MTGTCNSDSNIEGQDSQTTLLMGLSAFMEIVPAFINGFELLPLSDSSTLPALTSNDPDKGFPKTSVLAFRYFLVKNKTNVRGATSQSPSTQTPQKMRHNDEEEFKPPTTLWGVARVQGNKNVMEAINSVAWDINNIGLSIRWKEHQSAESSAQILLMCCPPIFDRRGIEEEICLHLQLIKKDLIRKGKPSYDFIGVPLPVIIVSWQQNKQGRGRNRAEQGLSMNNLEAFQNNGCQVCTVEAKEGLWARLGPLWQQYHKTGMCRHSLGQQVMMVVMFGGKPTESNG